jgi:cytochrome c553
LDGTTLAVPALFVNNQVSGSSEAATSTTTTTSYGGAVVVDPDPGSGRFNPGLVVIQLPSEGLPSANDVEVFALQGEVARYESNDTFVRSYITHAVFSPDKGQLVLSMEASNGVLVVPRTYLEKSSEIRGWVEVPRYLLATPAGPRSTVFGPNETLYGDFQVAGQVGALDFEEASRVIALFTKRSGHDDATQSEAPAHDARPLGDEQLQLDREKFTTAVDREMVGEGVGASCSTCHYEGRNDGLSWALENGLRQTPSLAGEVSLTAPMTWADNVESAAEEVRLTTTARLGGHGASAETALAVAAWIDYGRLPEPATHGVDSVAVARGEALFEDPRLECRSCHVPPTYTNNRAYDLLGDGEMDVPSLLGVSATAPYLHDGSMASLRDVLDWSQTGAMGDTSGLSEQEMQDLEAFLRSLWGSRCSES